MNHKNPSLSRSKFEITLIRWVVFTVCFVLLANIQAVAQKLLDPAAPLTVVTASSGGTNSSVSLAVAIRQLKTTYDHAAITAPVAVSGFSNSTTPLLRVKRSSDNGQLDIGYDGSGNLDTVILKNFVSNNGVNPTANGTVTIWYDQSGNSRDLYPPTTAAEPRIVTAGVVERNSGNQIGITGVNGGMMEHRPTSTTTFNGGTGANIYGINGDRTMNVVSQPKVYSGVGTAGDGAGTYLIDRYGDPNTANGGTPTGIDQPLTSLKAVGTNWALQIRLNSGAGFPTGSFSGSIGISTSRSDNVMVVRSADIYALYVNGVLAGNQTLVGSNDMSPVRIGYGSSTGESVYYGEFILFPSALSSDDLNALNTSQTAYYVLGIPGSNWTGATNTDWATASNWSNLTVPDALASITIPSGTPNAPTISSTVSLKKLTISTGATLTNNGTLNLSDSFTVNGTLAGTGTVVMNGGFQQIISGTTTPIVFANLTIGNSINSVVTNNNINVTGTLTVSSGATFAPIATAVINNAAAAGTITGTGTVRVTRIAAAPDYQSQYKFTTNTLTNLTVDYAGAGAQNINFTGVNYGNLAVSGSGTKTLSAAVTTGNVTGNISVTAATLDNGAFAMAGNGARTFSVSNGATFLLSGATSTYPTGFGTFTFGASSTVNYGGSGAQTVVAANYGNLTFSSTGARTLPNGTVGIAGTYTPSTNTITIGTGTLDFNGTGAQTIPASTYYNLTVSGARTATPNLTFASGTVSIANTASFTATGATYVVTGNTVNYSRAGAQTLDNDFAYNNLTLSGTGTKTTTGVTVNGILSLEGDATVVMSAAPTYGVSSTLQFNKTVAYTVNNANWPTTFSGSGGVVIMNTGVITINNNKAITYNLTIASGASINLGGNNGSTADGLILGGVGQVSGTWGYTGSGATNINTVFFANNTGRIAITAGTAYWMGSTNTDWATTTNWSTGAVPTTTTNVVIPSGTPNQPTIGAAAVCDAITINSGATLTINNTLDVSGTFTIDAGGTLTSTSTITFNSNFVNNGTATLNSSPIVIAGATAQSIGAFTTTGAITISKTAQTATFTGATNAASLTFTATGSTLSLSNTLTLTGALTLNSAAGSNVTAAITGAGTIACGSVAVGTTVTPASNQTTILTSTLSVLDISANLTLASSRNGGNRNNPTFTHTSGTVTIDGSLTTVNVNANTMTYAMGNSGPVLNFTGATPFNLAGAGTNTIDFVGTNAVVNYNGASLQTLPAVAITYTTMKVNNTAGVTLGAAAAITTLTIGDVTANSIFNDGGFTISTVTTLNLTSGTYNLGSAGTGNAWPAWGTRNIAAGTTVGYVSGVAQTVSATPAYSNLTFTGAGTKTIAAGGTLSIGQDWSITGGAATFTTTAGATVGGDILGSGNITMGTTGTITLAGAWGNNGTFNKGTLSTVNYNGTTGQTIVALSYHNLTISGTRVGAPPIVLATGTITVSGAFSVTTTGISGYTNTGNTVEYNGTGAQSIAAINYNNLTISTARTGSPAITFPAATVGIAGALTTSATGVGSYVVTGNTVDYYGGIAQTIGVFNYNNLTISGTRSGSPTITLGSGTVGIAGVFSITTAGVSTYAVTGNTINYNAAAGAQTLINTFAYNNLTISNTSGTQTAAGNLTVNAALTTTAGGTLNMATFALSAGTITNGGTIRTQNTSGTPLPTGLTIAGTVNYDAATGGQTIRANTYTNLTFGNTSGIQVAPANLSPSGTLTTTAGGTLNMATFTLSAGTITNGGTIRTQNTSGTPLPSGLTITGTVNYDAATGGQTVRGNTYTTLTMGNTSGTQTADGNITTTTLNNNTAGIILNMSTFTLAATTINNNATATIRTQSTTNPCMPNGLTIGGIVIYNATTGAQFIGSNTYTTLTMGNTSGTQTANGNITATTLNNNTNAADILNMGTFTLTATTVNNTGTIRTQNTSGTPIPAALTYGGTIQYDGVAQTVVNANYTNLNLAGSGVKTLNASMTSLAGSLTMSGTATATLVANLSIAADLNIGTGTTLTFSTFTANRATAGGTLTVAGSMLLGNNTGGQTGSNFPTNYSTTTLTGGTVNYNRATGGQTIFATPTYTSLTLGNTSGTNTASGNLVVDGTLTTTAGGTLDLGASNTLGGTLGTINHNGTIATQSTTAALPTGRAWGGTINYNRTAGGQAVVSATSYNNLTASNTSGTQTSGGNLVVNGTLTTTAGGILALATNTLSGTLATIANNGTISTTNTGATPIPSGRTWGGRVWYFASTGGQTLVSGVYSTLEMRNTSGTNTMDGNITVSTDLNFSSGGKAAIGNHTLTINGTITDNSATATFVLNGNSNIVIGGSGSLNAGLFVDQTTPGTTNRLANLTFNRASQTITLGNALQVTGTVTPTAGTLASAGFLTLISNASGTARIASGGCTTCSYITGNVNVQRNIPAMARRWRFMGSPVTTSTLADWQTETYITGAGGAANGFDATLSNQASVYGYNESITTGDLNTGWVAATNITNNLEVGKGYRVFIRGDRSDAGRLTGSNTTQNEVTLDLVGVPNQGDITMPVTFSSSGTPANDGWNLVSNPYASPYDWNAHYDNGGFHANLDPSIQILSAVTGGYIGYSATGNIGGLTGGIIPPGASFWVKGTGGVPSLIFKEQFKVGTVPVGLFKTNENEGFSIQLVLDSSTSDAVYIKYMNAATANYDSFDIIKLGATVSISTYGNDNIMLAGSVRPIVNNAVDTIKLKVTAGAGSYKLVFANNEQIAVQENVFLIDTYLSTVTDLKVTSEYPFAITTGVAATQGLNRFYIVVANNTSLPVKLLTFGARSLDNKTASLNWATAQETNNEKFVIERSGNGKIFEKIGEIAGNGTTAQLINYSFIDKQPNKVNYYRLKQVDYDGTTTYSSIRTVNFGQASMSLTMYPIPAKQMLTISHITNIKHLHIYDVTGKEVYVANDLAKEAKVNVEGLIEGVYFVELTDEIGSITKDKFIKE